METEIKKRKHRKGGTDYAKEKLAKAEAEKAKLQEQLAQALSERNNYSAQLDRAKTEIHNLKIDCNGKQSTIEKQGSKISELSGDLANAQSEAREYRSKFEEAVRRMGWLRRWWYEYDRPQFTDEDHWHD